MAARIQEHQKGAARLSHAEGERKERQKEKTYMERKIGGAGDGVRGGGDARARVSACTLPYVQYAAAIGPGSALVAVVRVRPRLCPVTSAKELCEMLDALTRCLPF